MDDDMNESLHQLSLRHGESIISQIVKIGSERNQKEHHKSRPFVSSLQCLQPNGTQLYRRAIDAFRNRKYVALSYTWDPSDHEDKELGQYLVEDWDNNCLQPSTVQKCVLDRAINYMRHARVRFLWIDAHCIRQDASGAEKCDALQAMDLVYQLSEHPVALLGRPLNTRPDLRLLAQVLEAKLVGASFRLSVGTTVREASRALWLLYDITRDRWWERAWTFQENYRGGSRMRLLIRHDPSLEQEKLRHSPVFGRILGELCVSSVIFFTQATRLCLALRKAAGSEPLPLNRKRRIDGVLRAAGRYTLLLDGLSCMTPTLIADIETRELSMPSDRLAIIANCLQYKVRLDSEALSGQGRSLSLSMLAMCLRNGEMLNNSNDGIASAAEMTASEFLKRTMFREFSPPDDDAQWLMFNKGCRLADVELTPGGIATSGHLWKLGCIIDTSRFPRRLPKINEPRGRLDLWQRKCLLQLVLRLDHPQLTEQIDDYLADDAESYTRKDFASFSEMYLHRMAVELAEAIRTRQKLRLGCIWESTVQTVPYSAVFVWSGEGRDGADRSPPAYVFTSMRQGDPGSQAHDANDIDRHVSLEVELEEHAGNSSIPHLRVRSWLHGMCFFNRRRRRMVVFPWPRALQAVRP